MTFNETNYRRLRAYLLTREGKFDWNTADSTDPDTDPGCVACACLRLESGFTRGAAIADNDDIRRFLVCTESEADSIYFPNFPDDEVDDVPNRNVHAAIARLDDVAARYGVTPESSATQVQDESGEVRRNVASVSEVPRTSTPLAEPVRPASRSETFTPNPDAFLGELRQFASETRAAYPVETER